MALGQYLDEISCLFFGRGNPHDNAMPKVISDPSTCIVGLSIGINCFRILFGIWSKKSKCQTENLPVCNLKSIAVSLAFLARARNGPCNPSYWEAGV